MECISSAVATIQVFASGFALPVVLGEVSCFSRFQFAFEAYCAVGDRIAVYSAVLFGRPGALFACGAKSGIKNAQGRAGIYIYIYIYIHITVHIYIYIYVQYNPSTVCAAVPPFEQVRFAVLRLSTVCILFCFPFLKYSIFVQWSAYCIAICRTITA